MVSGADQVVKSASLSPGPAAEFTPHGAGMPSPTSNGHERVFPGTGQGRWARKGPDTALGFHGIFQARILGWVAISYSWGIFPIQRWNEPESLALASSFFYH